MTHRRPRASTTALAALLAAVSVLASCADDSTSTSTTPPAEASTETSAAAPSTSAGAADTGTAGCATDPAALGPRSSHERVDLDVDGTTRWYMRYVPASYDGAPVPLVIELHGYLSGAAGQVAMSDMAAVAEDEGFVLVTPQGSSELPYWNAVPHEDLPDDVALVEAVIDDVGGAVCLDPARVYVDGFSNGAFLTSLVACRLSDRVAAVAALAGLLDPAACEPSRPVPVLTMHGTEDQLVSFTGPPNPGLGDLVLNEQSRRAFDGLVWGDVREAAAAWATRNACVAEPARSALAEHVELVAYTGCAGDADVQLYVLQGAGHTWPGSAFAAAAASLLGPPNDEIDGSRIIWDFFAAHPMD